MIKEALMRWMMEENGSKQVAFFLAVYPFIRILLFPIKAVLSCFRGLAGGIKGSSKKSFPVQLKEEEEIRWNSSYKVLFAGDLLLLEDQVKRGRRDGTFNFDDIFEPTKKYIEAADLAIGVFEGPMAGKESGFSNSNYGDGKAVSVNFPDEFGRAVKNAGFNLVTLANNHLMDKGEKGAMRTLDMLDEIGIEHVGAYRSSKEKAYSRVKIIESRGIRFAVLAYTFDCSNNEEQRLMDGDLSYITSFLPLPSSKYFKKALTSVESDFAEAKKNNPDFIIVLPHVGMQFLKKPDYNENRWCGIFLDLGADIVLCDHAHAVAPVEMRKSGSRNTFVAYCPGNFVNIYRDYDGDIGMLVEINVDAKEKKIIGGGVIPMWINSRVDGNYRPVPLEDYITNEKMRSVVTTYDLERVDRANSIVTRVVFGEDIPLDQLRTRYIFDVTGRRRLRSEQISIAGFDMEGSILYKWLKKAKICCIGDSITEGTMNGGYPWYEPIEMRLRGRFENHSWGGGTIKTVLSHIDEIKGGDADLYVIAIGTNDIRYCDTKRCAMTETDFINGIGCLVQHIKKNLRETCFIFIAPWISQENDPFCPLTQEKKLEKFKKYTDALREYCREKGFFFLNPNKYIQDRIDREIAGFYLVDHIHPNSRNGIYLYSEAILECYREDYGREALD